MSTKTLKKAMTAGSLLVLFAGVALGQEPASPPPVNALSTRYLIQDLGIVGPVEGQPFVITANGYVAGLAVVPSGGASVAHAVYWHGTSMKDISSPGLGGTNSAAFGINLWGQIVGEAENATPDPNGEDFCGFQSLGFTGQANSCLPYLFQNGAMTALPRLRDESGKSGVSGQAWQINTLGVAVGSSENTTSDTTCPGLPTSHQKFQFKPVVWYKLFPWSEERIHELSTVSGDPDGVALAVNERGEAAGGSGTCGPFNAISLFNLVPRHAILWQNGKPIDLGNLGGDGLFVVAEAPSIKAQPVARFSLPVRSIPTIRGGLPASAHLLSKRGTRSVESDCGETRLSTARLFDRGSCATPEKTGAIEVFSKAAAFLLRRS